MRDQVHDDTAEISDPARGAGRLYFLDMSGDRIRAANPDGSDLTTVVGGIGRFPDGVAIDPEAGHVYWTIMGVPQLNDGSIERVDLDGGNRTVIVPPGVTHTPKQLHLDREGRKLYWCDREGMRVMRANLDGSQVETLVENGRGEADGRDKLLWCVGVTLDRTGGKIYWSQKGPDNAYLGRILRAGIELPPGESPSKRSDIEVVFDNLPEPIDLELDPDNRVLYWTDRGDPPRGNTVNRAPIDLPAEPEVLITHLMEGIGLALDLAGGRMFVTDLGGSIYSANLDGSDARTPLMVQGNLTGIAFVEL